MNSGMEPSILGITRKNIWQFRQNKPSLVVRDLLKAVKPSADLIYSILLARGVFKWLSVRRDLIKLKNVWKEHIKYLEMLRGMYPKSHPEHQYLKGQIKALEDCRKEIRNLCHSERWVAPDFDRDAQRWLESKDEAEATRRGN